MGGESKVNVLVPKKPPDTPSARYADFGADIQVPTNAASMDGQEALLSTSLLLPLLVTMFALGGVYQTKMDP